ncbi:MAG TPA: SurA N-terminal domain-containing protein [Gallionella sp.]|nr:SurA N-terminal domain-containing protein [Gallionella sp.]
MFDFVHENKKLVQIVLLLIVLSFAFWGVNSYRQSGNVEALATVNGTKISSQEFDKAMRRQQGQLRQALGENFDAKMFETPEARLAILDNLINQRLLVEQATAFRLIVTDEQVAGVISSIGAFQDAGKFDKKLYESVLARQNLLPVQFEAQVRDELAAQQLRDSYTQNGFAPNSTTQRLIRINQQQRQVRAAKILFQPYMAQAKVDVAGLKNYYESNQKEFQVPDQVRVEYVTLSVNNLLPKAIVSDEDARKYYDEHRNDFGITEQRHAAHILISLPKEAPQAEQDAAKHKAEQVLKLVKQDPAKFAQLAKQYSQDTGSAANGGDLGFFDRGAMTKSFDEAVFSLKQGEISEVVRSDFGYHIIKLIAIKPGHVSEFNEKKNEIVGKLRLQKAMDMYAELAEQFSSAVYEQSDTLKPAAQLANGSVEQSGWLSKGDADHGLWTVKMLQAIFTDEAIKNKRNTAAIEVAPNTLLAARVVEYKSASVRPLSEVQDAILQKLSRQQATKLAIAQGKTVLEQLQKGDKPGLQWGAVQTISLAQHADMDKAMVRQIFRSNVAKLPLFIGTETADGYTLVSVDAVNEVGSIDDAKLVRYAQELRQLTGEELFQSYLNDARRQANIKINMPQLPAIEP